MKHIKLFYDQLDFEKNKEDILEKNKEDIKAMVDIWFNKSTLPILKDNEKNNRSFKICWFLNKWFLKYINTTINGKVYSIWWIGQSIEYA